MKRILIFAVLLLPLFCAASELRVAVVDMEKLFSNYYKTKIADASLKRQLEIYGAWSKKLGQTLMKYQEEFNVLRDAAQNIALSPGERQKKNQEAKEKYAQMKQKRAEIEQYNREKETQYKALEEKKRSEIIDEIKKAVARRCALEGITLVLDKSGRTLNNLPCVIYASSSYDLTDVILREINRGHEEKKKPVAKNEPEQ